MIFWRIISSLDKTYSRDLADILIRAKKYARIKEAFKLRDAYKAESKNKESQPTA